MRFARTIFFVLALVLPFAGTRAGEPLTVEAKIPLGKVAGRIDHLAVDLAHKRLFVAELGNNSVGVIDLSERKVVKRLSGLKEPQGLGYLASSDTLYAANAGDGSVRLFRGADLSPTGRIGLGEDADNVRIDSQADKVYVGYSNGAVAVVDPVKREVTGKIQLKGHPESFQLDPAGGKIWANVPDARQVAVLDRNSQRQVTEWPLNVRANFPMAIDPASRKILIVSRQPAKLIAFDADSGERKGETKTCGDSDDVFVDAKRQRIYVICGEGAVDIFKSSMPEFERIGSVHTVQGARTGLFVPELDRLFVAVRAKGAEPAAIWVLRPEP
jgi:DNA-binding beta-propeller fold protein YncE